MTRVKSRTIRKDFIRWNGWGPPESQYQIIEYCREKTRNQADSDEAFEILLEWLNQNEPT